MGCGKSKAAAPAAAEKKEEEAPAPAAPEVSAEDQAVAQLKTLFDTIDMDANKTVDRSELTKVMKNNDKFGALLEQAKMENKDPDVALQQLDTNQDGRVSWDEFLAKLKEAATKQVEDTGKVEAAEESVEEKAKKRLQDIFNSIDTNSDKMVSKDELAQKLNADEGGKDEFINLLTSAGLTTTFAVLEQLDTDKDGKVSFEEFYATLQKAATEEVKATGDVAAAPEILIEDQGAAKNACC